MTIWLRWRLRYIDRNIAHAANARVAAAKPRPNGKWSHLKGDALKIAADLAEQQPDLKPSELVTYLLNELNRVHEKLPDERTIRRWIKDFGH